MAESGDAKDFGEKIFIFIWKNRKKVMSAQEETLEVEAG